MKPAPKGRKYRGYCSVCGKSVGVKLDGKPQTHYGNHPRDKQLGHKCGGCNRSAKGIITVPK